ncbi:hypothetical protein EOD39_2945 [Acipenser ruthenus]|uniref:Uncharacterized protein n=1 Tax=Acipenser ruthenus TaxID=7906 RepID=A0A444TX76_ACIRT|nr:hypothetical protein EOD39_2945 [Acipenser ruthenus]
MVVQVGQERDTSWKQLLHRFNPNLNSYYCVAEKITVTVSVPVTMYQCAISGPLSNISTKSTEFNQCWSCFGLTIALYGPLTDSLLRPSLNYFKSTTVLQALACGMSRLGDNSPQERHSLSNVVVDTALVVVQLASGTLHLSS